MISLGVPMVFFENFLDFDMNQEEGPFLRQWYEAPAEKRGGNTVGQ